VNIYALIPFISVIAYIVLIGFVATRPLARVHKVFILYLTVSAMWSLSSFTLHANFFPTQTLLSNRVLLMLGGAVPIIYYHFTRAFFNKSAGRGVYLGYAGAIGFAIFISQGGMLQSSHVVDGILYHELDATFYLFSLFGAVFFGMAIFYLIRGIRSATYPQERNRSGYLLAAASIWALFMLTNYSPALANYSVDHIGSIANALIIGYAILKFHLLDIRFVMRRGLAYLLVIICLGGIYASTILLGHALLPDQPLYNVLLFASGLTILLALLARPLRYAIQERVDRFFYRGTYHYRQTLLNFSGKMGSIINLNELADEMLPTISKALHITQAKLLFEDTDSGDFTTQFTYPKAKGELRDELTFDPDNPIVAWLEKEAGPLDLTQIDSIPQFKGLWQTEREKLVSSNLELLCPIKSRDKLIGILALGRKLSDTLYSQEDIELVVSMASQVGIVIANARLFQESQKSRERLEVINEIIRIISSSLDIGKVYEAFSASVKKLVDFDQASIHLLDESRQNLRVLAISQDTASKVKAGHIIPLSASSTGWVTANKRAIIEGDLAEKRRFLTDEELLAQGFRATICLPLLSKGEVIGTFNLRSRRPHAYGQREQEILEQLAAQIAGAIESAMAHDDLKKQQLRVEQLLTQAVLAREEERKMISVDLHDSVAQWLVAASYRAQACSRVLEGDGNDEAIGELANMESTISKSLNELRRVMIGLRPPALDELGLTHALRQSLEDLKADGLGCKFSEVGTPLRLPSNVEIAVYRVVQEALTNIRKHANATKVALRIQFQEDKLLVEVHDNGKGFGLSQTLDSAISVGHMGLLGMQQRVEMLGGDIRIKTSEGTGTTITLNLPTQSQVE